MDGLSQNELVNGVGINSLALHTALETISVLVSSGNSCGASVCRKGMSVASCLLVLLAVTVLRTAYASCVLGIAPSAF